MDENSKSRQAFAGLGWAALAAFGLLAVCCKKAQPQSLASSAPFATGSTRRAPVPSASMSRVGAEPAPAKVPDAPALFMRVANALMPLACARAGTWAHGQVCVDRAASEPVWLYPRLEKDSATVRGRAAVFHFQASDKREAGLLVPGAEIPSDVDGPFLGFGVVGTTSPVRFTPATLQRLEKETAQWCRTKRCAGLSLQSLRSLPAGAPSQATTRSAETQIAPFLASKVKKSRPTRKATSFGVLVSGREEQIIVLELDLEGVPTDDDVSPAEEHFLVAQRGEVFRHLITAGAYTNGLGESGELLAAVDLDGDGTDELILEWRYSEGRWYRLVQRRGDSLVLLGEFGIGT